MEYIKLFGSHSNYEDFVSGGTMELPNVSHCVNENEVHYNPVAKELELYTITGTSIDGVEYSFRLFLDREVEEPMENPRVEFLTENDEMFVYQVEVYNGKLLLNIPPDGVYVITFKFNYNGDVIKTAPYQLTWLMPG